MSNVVSMADYRNKKAKAKSDAAEAIRRSIDNEEVKKRYKLPATPDLEQRTEKIRASIQRINQLMGQIRDGEGDR